MNIQTPATPASAATPGVDSQNGNNQPAVPPVASTSGASGNNQEGKVTINLKDYAQLQRDAARSRSADRRSQLNAGRNQPAVAGGDPDVAKAIQEANDRAADAERKVMQVEVKEKVRDLLDKPEFEKIPKSTKAVILQNPALLSKADNLEEAMLDIEDFVRDQVLVLELGVPGSGQPAVGNQQPAGHQTPPASGAGAPGDNNPAGLEDLSKLSGPSRSQAAIRNAIKSQKGTKKV